MKNKIYFAKKYTWTERSLYLRCCASFFLAGSIFISGSYGQAGFRVAATAKQLLSSVCQTTNVKLVFLCQDTLWYVDFSESTPQIRQLSNSVSPYFPVISSDGKWVAYQTDVDAEGPYFGSNVGKVWMSELSVDGTPCK